MRNVVDIAGGYKLKVYTGMVLNWHIPVYTLPRNSIPGMIYHHKHPPGRCFSGQPLISAHSASLVGVELSTGGGLVRIEGVRQRAHFACFWAELVKLYITGRLEVLVFSKRHRLALMGRVRSSRILWTCSTS